MPVRPTIGSPSWRKNKANPPPPERVMGRSGIGPFSITRAARAAIPSASWSGPGASTSRAQMPEPSITTRQLQPGNSSDHRAS